MKTSDIVPSLESIFDPYTVAIDEAALFAPILKASTRLNREINIISIIL
jgi:hypothetical protein